MYLLMYCMFKVYEIYVFGTPVLRSDLDRRQSFGLIDVLVPVVCTDSTAGLSLNFRRRARSDQISYRCKSFFKTFEFIFFFSDFSGLPSYIQPSIRPGQLFAPSSLFLIHLSSSTSFSLYLST